MFRSFREFFKGVGFGANHANNRQIGFAHPASVGSSNHGQSYNSNDDVVFNAYLKDGSIHQVKLIDAEDYLEKNKDNILLQPPVFRRPKLG